MENVNSKTFLENLSEEIHLQENSKLYKKFFRSHQPRVWLMEALVYSVADHTLPCIPDNYVLSAIVLALHKNGLVSPPQEEINHIYSFLNRTDVSPDYIPKLLIEFCDRLSKRNSITLGITSVDILEDEQQLKDLVNFAMHYSIDKSTLIERLFLQNRIRYSHNERRSTDKSNREGLQKNFTDTLVFSSEQAKLRNQCIQAIDTIVKNSFETTNQFIHKTSALEEELRDLRFKLAQYEEDKKKSIPEGVEMAVNFNSILNYIESCCSVEDAFKLETMLYKLMRNCNVDQKYYQRIDASVAKVREREPRYVNNFNAPITNNGTLNGDVKYNQDKKDEQ